MAVVSEHSGDSNDGDANKNPRDESKKPQEVVANLVRLPDDVLASILARLRRCDYTALSHVSPVFRRIILSSELYNARHEIGNTETFLYALMRFPYSIFPCWYTLDKTEEPFRLRRIKKLANVPYDSALVTSGLHVYVIGGTDRYGGIMNTVFRIDFRSNEIEILPKMCSARSRAAGAVFDGKIYVIGGCEEVTSDWAEVFDVDSKVWTPLPGPFNVVCSSEAQFVKSAVMKDKLYVLDHSCCFTYEPRKNKWDTLCGKEKTSMMKSWKQCSCVVDDVLYTFQMSFRFGTVISYGIVTAFDPKEKYWRPVTIEGRFPMPVEFLYDEAKMVNCGGNLVILGWELMRDRSYWVLTQKRRSSYWA